jgi:hypothetical protein
LTAIAAMSDAQEQIEGADNAVPPLARVAHYVRMSTDHQKYSTENQAFLAVSDLTQIEPWRTLPPSLPIFIAQGDEDQTVRPQVTRDYAAKLCTNHSRLTLLWMPKVGHGAAAMKSTLTALRWIADRFAGQPPPDDCPRN